MLTHTHTNTHTWHSMLECDSHRLNWHAWMFVPSVAVKFDNKNTVTEKLNNSRGPKFAPRILSDVKSWVASNTTGVIDEIAGLACIRTYNVIHTYIHTYIYIHAYTYVHACIHAYIHTYMHAYIHANIQTNIHGHLRVIRKPCVRGDLSSNSNNDRQ